MRFTSIIALGLMSSTLFAIRFLRPLANLKLLFKHTDDEIKS